MLVAVDAQMVRKNIDGREWLLLHVRINKNAALQNV